MKVLFRRGTRWATGDAGLGDKAAREWPWQRQLAGRAGAAVAVDAPRSDGQVGSRLGRLGCGRAGLSSGETGPAFDPSLQAGW